MGPSRRCRLAVLLAVAAASGCNDSVAPATAGADSSEESGDELAICDGSHEIRLAVSRRGGGPDVELMREIGTEYLYVLGTCEYWVLGLHAQPVWPDARYGILDEPTVSALAAELEYYEWDRLRGAWGTSTPIADATTLLLHDGSSTISCYSDCNDSAEVAEISQRASSWIHVLWDGAQPVEGGLRAIAYSYPTMADPSFRTWPLSWPISQIAKTSSEHVYQEGSGVVIDDAEDAATLRAWRSDYRDGTIPREFANTLTQSGLLMFIDSENVGTNFWMRDSIPIENDRGLIPIPLP